MTYIILFTAVCNRKYMKNLPCLPYRFYQTALTQTRLLLIWVYTVCHLPTYNQVVKWISSNFRTINFLKSIEMTVNHLVRRLLIIWVYTVCHLPTYNQVIKWISSNFRTIIFFKGIEMTVNHWVRRLHLQPFYFYKKLVRYKSRVNMVHRN